MIRRPPRSTLSATLFPYTTSSDLPTALIIPPIAPIKKHTLSEHYGEIGERVPVIQHQKIEIDSSDTFVFGDSFNVQTINYHKGSAQLSLDVHKLDFNSVLTHDMHWCIGSCPHLFAKTDELQYIREILVDCQNVIGVDTYDVPDGVSELWICELEDEDTFIESVFINNNEFIRNVTLHKGDKLVVPVSRGDRITFVGMYTPFNLPQNGTSQSLKRAEIVNAFIFSNSMPNKAFKSDS